MDAHVLISRCKAGDQQALHQLYEQYRPRLLSICRQYTKGEDVAEDLLHDAFVVILTSLDKLRDADKLESWMTTIVRNVGYHYRKHADKEQADLQQMASDNQDMTESGFMPDYEQLQALVALLPQRYQQVFRLSVFEGLSHQEIGHLLGISPHSSSSQLFHAKHKLRVLIKQAWVFVLLLIAIPVGIWMMIQKEEPIVATQQTPISKSSTSEAPAQPQVDCSPSDAGKPSMRQQGVSQQWLSQQVAHPELVVEAPHDKPVYAIVGEKEQVDSLMKTTQVGESQGQAHESIMNQTTSPFDSSHDTYIAMHKAKRSSWDIHLAYNGQIGRSNSDLSPAAVYTNSFAAASNSYIPSEYSYNNWIDYSWSLNNAIPEDNVSVETRSLMEIAAKNAMIDHGEMVARHTHQLPFTIQLTLSRQLTSRFFVETGLSYTQMKSTITTGSTTVFIQEQQRLRYLGIPLRFGYKWYNRSHLSLYTSAGAMLELPVKCTLDIHHELDNVNTFQKETSLDVPNQWSTQLGIGLQYDLMPNLGLYVEPSLQYFFDDGSTIKSYRTEHPLQVTLPLGVRYHW